MRGQMHMRRVYTNPRVRLSDVFKNREWRRISPLFKISASEFLEQLSAETNVVISSMRIFRGSAVLCDEDQSVQIRIMVLPAQTKLTAVPSEGSLTLIMLTRWFSRIERKPHKKGDTEADKEKSVFPPFPVVLLVHKNVSFSMHKSTKYCGPAGEAARVL